MEETKYAHTTRLFHSKTLVSNTQVKSCTSLNKIQLHKWFYRVESRPSLLLPDYWYFME